MNGNPVTKADFMIDTVTLLGAGADTTYLLFFIS
jgi:hypothetical protein